MPRCPSVAHPWFRQMEFFPDLVQGVRARGAPGVGGAEGRAHGDRERLQSSAKNARFPGEPPSEDVGLVGEVSVRPSLCVWMLNRMKTDKKSPCTVIGRRGRWFLASSVAPDRNTRNVQPWGPAHASTEPSRFVAASHRALSNPMPRPPTFADSARLA